MCRRDSSGSESSVGPSRISDKKLKLKIRPKSRDVGNTRAKPTSRRGGEVAILPSSNFPTTTICAFLQEATRFRILSILWLPLSLEFIAAAVSHSLGASSTLDPAMNGLTLCFFFGLERLARESSPLKMALIVWCRYLYNSSVWACSSLHSPTLLKAVLSSFNH